MKALIGNLNVGNDYVGNSKLLEDIYLKRLPISNHKASVIVLYSMLCIRKRV